MSLSLSVSLIWRFAECVCVLIKQLLWTRWDIGVKQKKTKKKSNHTTRHGITCDDAVVSQWVFWVQQPETSRWCLGRTSSWRVAPLFSLSSLCVVVAVSCHHLRYIRIFDFPNKWNSIINAIFKCPQTTFKYLLFYVGFSFGVSVSEVCVSFCVGNWCDSSSSNEGEGT